MSGIGAAAAYRTALESALAQREEQGKVLREARRHVVALEQRDHQLVFLARQLLKELPGVQKSEYLRRFPWLSEGPDPATRQAVLIGIMQLFVANPSQEMTTPEIERALEAQGIHANSKRIYNTLNYLAADGRLKRQARGKYVLADASSPVREPLHAVPEESS